MVKLFLHRMRNTVGGGGGTAISSPHPAMHRRGSDGSATACPSTLSPPPAPSLFVDPVLAEAMAGVIKAMQRPSKLSSDHFEAALGIAAIGADSFGEQGLFISNSGTDRKFCASAISKWAESRRTTSKKKATPPLPSKVVADLLCKAAAPLSRRACPGQSEDAIERQLELGLQRSQRPGHEEAVGGPSFEEEDAVPALDQHFNTVASALLSALHGRGWGHSNGDLGVRNMNNGVSSNSSGNWGAGVTEAWATASEELVATRPAAAAAAVTTEPSILSFSTAWAIPFSASSTISTPPSSPSASSPSHCPTTTAAIPSTGDSFSPLEDDCRRRRQHGRNGNQGHQPPPPPPPRLFITENSVSRLAARAFKAEKESSIGRAGLQRLTGQLSDVQDQLRASEYKSAAYAFELEKVTGQLAAAEEEALACKERLKEACSYIRKLAAEKKSTDKLVGACHLRVKSIEESVMAAVLQMGEAGAGVAAAAAAANPAASDDEVFHDSIGVEGEKEAPDGENACVCDVSLRIAVRSDVSSAGRRARRGNSASSCSDTDTSSLSSSSSGVGGDRQPAVAPERKAALDATFSALAREAGVDASAVRAEVLSDIAAARRAKASGHASAPTRSNSGAGSDGRAGVGRGVGSNESGGAETRPLAIMAAKRDPFEKKKKAGEAPVLQRHGSQSGLFLSPPSLHGTPANSPAGVKVNAGVTKRKDHDDDDDNVGEGIIISNGLLSTNVANGTPSAAEDEGVKRRPSTGSFGKRGPSIADRLRAAAAGPAIKLTAATRMGFGMASPPSTKEERDLSAILGSSHRGGVRAGAAADAPTGGAEGEAGIHATATEKKPFRFHPFRYSLSLHPDSAAGDVLAGDSSAGAPGGTGNGGRRAGAGPWLALDYNEGDRARSLLLRRHGLEFLKDVCLVRRWRKEGAGDRVGYGVVGEVFFLEFDDPAQERAVRDFTNGVGLVAKLVYKNATNFVKASFAKEVEILSSLISPGCHENIVTYLWVNPYPGVILMEAVAFDLQALLVDKRKLAALPRPRRMGLVADAVRGLSYLHKHASITHGDVKAANMMVNSSCAVLKLCDFGLSGRSHKDKVAGCTPLYASPEVVTGVVTANPAVMRPSMDTYSVGLVALQVLDLADEPRTSRFADELDGQPAKLCDLRDTLLEPWLWDARGGLCFEEEVTRLMMAWLSKFPPHRPPLGTLEQALENGRLWSRASPEQQRQKLLQRRQDELEMW